MSKPAGSLYRTEKCIFSASLADRTQTNHLMLIFFYFYNILIHRCISSYKVALLTCFNTFKMYICEVIFTLSQKRHFSQEENIKSWIQHMLEINIHTPTHPHTKTRRQHKDRKTIIKTILRIY